MQEQPAPHPKAGGGGEARLAAAAHQGCSIRCFRQRTSVHYVVVRRYALKYALCTLTVKGAVTYWLTA